MTQLQEINILPNEYSRDLVAPSGGYHLERICLYLGVGKADFARFSERRTEAVAKLFRPQPVKPRNPRTVAVLKEMTQIITIFKALGLIDQAKSWMRTPIPSFSGQTPSDLIEAGRGQELVDRLIANATGNVGT